MVSPSLRAAALPLLLCAVLLSAAPAAASLVNEVVSRHIDLTTHLATVKTEVKVKNTGSAAATSYTLVADSDIGGNLAFATAQVDSGSIVPISGSSIPVNIKAGGSASLEIVQVFSHTQRPFPSELAQADPQYVKFQASLYFPSAYATESQKTVVALAGKALSQTKVKPYKNEDNTITYGPYKDVAADAHETLKVHFENTSPFLTTTRYEREILVSHWGYTTITETAALEHSGGKLKGTFSRLDFQRNPQAKRNAIEQFTTRLPAAASDVYYRDVIGNISTSHLREEEEAVIVEIKPRFPLFGGWRTHYTLGYVLPTYELLFSGPAGYTVKTRFLSHLYDNFVVDEAVVKVVLPEGATDIKVDAPFPVERSDSVLVTYFDTTGRPVVELTAKNLVEEHMQEFSITYQFSSTSLVREPLMAVAFFTFLFFAAIVANRIDLSVSPKKEQ